MIFTKIRDLLTEETSRVLKARGKDITIPSFDVCVPPSKIPGDLAANVILTIAKEAKESPRDLAAAVVQRISSNSLIQKIDVAGPGFLNVWLTDEGFRGELEQLLSNQPASTKKTGGPKVLLEFVSANPTGPLHVGHGRGAALGDSLKRIFRYLGADVTAEFYINDAGGQIRNLGRSMEARIKELQGETVAFPEEGYKGSYVVEIAQQAIAEKRNFKPVTDSQMVFSEEDAAGYASVRILKDIQKTLGDFGVSFENWFNESSLHGKGEVIQSIEALRKKGHVYDQEGAAWFRATNFGDDKDRVLQKGNEAPTYFASDIAYHANKLARGFEKLVNIWGADHHGYAQRLKGALQALGQDPDKVHIIFNQLVSIKGGRLSKRAGDMVSLQEVVDEVGRDATRFFFALRSPGAHFEFDLDLAKKQANENPVFYVQYVHARCCSIFREAEKRGMKVDLEHWKMKTPAKPVAQAEKDVLLHLSSFDRVVEICAKDYSNHHLTVYLQELAGKFHSFYEQCTVLVDDPAVRSFRLALVEAIRKRVAEGLDLLGVSAPEKL